MDADPVLSGGPAEVGMPVVIAHFARSTNRCPLHVKPSGSLGSEKYQFSVKQLFWSGLTAIICLTGSEQGAHPDSGCAPCRMCFLEGGSSPVLTSLTL